MFKKLFNWLELKGGDLQEHGQDQQLEALSVPLATSVLYYEIIRADDELNDKEVDAFENLVLKEFAALQDDLKPLLKTIENKARESVDYMQFTRLIHENCTHAEKRRILTSLWHLAAIDGVIDGHEEHLIRRMSDLIYMDHRDFIQTKLEALERG